MCTCEEPSGVWEMECCHSLIWNWRDPTVPFNPGRRESEPVIVPMRAVHHNAVQGKGWQLNNVAKGEPLGDW